MSVGSVEASSSLVQKTDRRRLAKLMAKIDRAKAILAEYPVQKQTGSKIFGHCRSM